MSPKSIYKEYSNFYGDNKTLLDNKLLCFSEALIGGNDLIVDGNVNPIPIMFLRSFMFKNWDLNDNSNFQDHLIVMFNKRKGYRRNTEGQHIGNGGWIENHDEIEFAMKKEFGSHRFRLESFTSLSGEEQAELMLRTTIFISPAGGGSFSALFLRNRAAFLLLDKIDRVNNNNNASIPVFDWEIELWNKLPNLQLWRYNVEPSEYIKDDRIDQSNKYERGHYHLNISKLILNTKRAMKYVESYNKQLKNIDSCSYES